MGLNASKAPRKNARRSLYSAVLMVVLMMVLPLGIQAQTLIFQAESEKNTNPPLIDVTDSVPVDTSFTPPTSAPSSSPSSANSELLSMIEQLQEEIQALRGTVEEQTQQIRILKKSAKSRYLDLDKRILDLTIRASKQTLSHSDGLGVVTESAIQTGNVAKRVANNVTNVGNNLSVPASAELENSEDTKITAEFKKGVSEEERRAYNEAYALVKSRSFDLAIKEFYSFIDKYPDGDLAGNAYYWLGEVYLVLPQLEQAEQAFTIVVQAYQNHPKVADALYKLGVTLDRMQKPKQSEVYLMEVQKRYPNSTASKLAKSYKINR